MIKFENTVTPSLEQWIAVIMGTRNPLESWEKSDSCWYEKTPNFSDLPNGVLPVRQEGSKVFCIGSNDFNLMTRLRNAGTDHRKFMRMIAVYVDITAPRYWWLEFDTYKVGTVTNSCSTMHCIHKKEFTLDDFSTEHLIDDPYLGFSLYDTSGKYTECDMNSKDIIQFLCNVMNFYRRKFFETKDKKYWWQMIQLLPNSYNQKRTVMLNYEVLSNIYKSRNRHKLDEWREFCEWIRNLPCSELITGKM